jgi:CRISPR-associated endonuclease Cas1 subtype I-E
MADPWWRTGPQDLHRLEDRITSLYAERCHIDRDDNAIVLVNKARTVHVPAAGLAVLLIGPGSRTTHPAVTLLADSGTAVCWVGEQGVRLYATGTSTARGSQLQLRQAWLVTRPKERVAVARRMYDMRFPGEDTASGHAAAGPRSVRRGNEIEYVRYASRIRRGRTKQRPAVRSSGRTRAGPPPGQCESAGTGESR